MSLLDLDSRLPSAIDYQVPIPYKIGTNSYAVHDAGIVYLEDNPYIIVIMYTVKTQYS